MIKTKLVAPLFVSVLLFACSKPAEEVSSSLSEALTGQAPTMTENCGALDRSLRSFQEGQPRLVVQTLDCQVFDLDEQRGSWVLINFWATWCAPCLKEIPDFNELNAGDHNLKLIGLAFEEISVAEMQQFFAEKVRPEYPIAIIDTFNPPADFDTPRGLPTTVLINPQGKIEKQFIGPVTAEMLLPLIQRNQ